MYIITHVIALQAKSGKYFQIWFFARFLGKNVGLLNMRMQVILDSSFARPSSAPIWGGKKGECRDIINLVSGCIYTILLAEFSVHCPVTSKLTRVFQFVSHRCLYVFNFNTLVVIENVKVTKSTVKSSYASRILWEVTFEKVQRLDPLESLLNKLCHGFF